MVFDVSLDAESIPTPFSSLLYVSAALTFLFSSGLELTKEFEPATPHDSSAPYDPGTKSWLGTDGLRYKVPVMDLPSQYHCHLKSNNIKVLLDNVQECCLKDRLPATAAEKKFWYEYNFLYWKMVLTPFCASFPVLLYGLRGVQPVLPQWAKGRLFPLFISCTIADEYAKYNFPGKELLHKSLVAQTPLGDAARAEWQRLQPINISPMLYLIYSINRTFGIPFQELAFGGETREIHSWM